MHDQPIDHLYTNKKLRFRVITNNHKRFISHARYDQSIRQLADNIRQVYNDMLTDPTHKYYKPSFRAQRIYNLRVKSYYLRPGDIVSDILNDYDEVECDVEEALMKEVKQENASPQKVKPTRVITVSAFEMRESNVSIPSFENSQNISASSKKRKRRNNKNKQMPSPKTTQPIQPQPPPLQIIPAQVAQQPVVHQTPASQPVPPTNLPATKTQQSIQSAKSNTETKSSSKYEEPKIEKKTPEARPIVKAIDPPVLRLQQSKSKSIEQHGQQSPTMKPLKSEQFKTKHNQQRKNSSSRKASEVFLVVESEEQNNVNQPAKPENEVYRIGIGSTKNSKFKKTFEEMKVPSEGEDD